MPSFVLDTNIALDLFLFDDPRTKLIRQQLQTEAVCWIATPRMRDEFNRVLTYPHLQSILDRKKKSSAEILQAFDAQVQIHFDTIEKAPYACKDVDDQVFVDLACALAKQGQTVELWSKDKAVLCMRKRLQRLSVSVKTFE